jgi:hypothetical protein
MLNHKPKEESPQATLARVKKEMDEPREVESVREEEGGLPDHVAEDGNTANLRHRKQPRSVHAPENAPEAGK